MNTAVKNKGRHPIYGALTLSNDVGNTVTVYQTNHRQYFSEMKLLGNIMILTKAKLNYNWRKGIMSNHIPKFMGVTKLSIP